MIVTSRYAKKFNVVVEEKTCLKERIRCTAKSIWVILLMLIIFGGIMGGLFTATEASAVAVLYALLVSMIIYRQIKIKNLPSLFVAAAKTTAALSFLLACASLLRGH